MHGELGIENETAGRNGLRRIPRVFNGFLRFEPAAVVLLVPETVDAVLEVRASRCGGSGHGGDGAPAAGQHDIVVFQNRLQFGDVFFIDAARCGVVMEGDGGGRADRLAEQRTCRHDAGGAHAEMRAGDVATREEQIIYILGIEASVGDVEGRRRFVMGAEETFAEEGVRMVVVQRPAAVGDDVRKMDVVHDVVLCQHVIADETRAFAFPGETADPVELVVFATAVRMVFHVVPHAVGDGFQLPLDVPCVGDGIDIAAVFDPPEVVVVGIESFIGMDEAVVLFGFRHDEIFIREFHRPRRRDEGAVLRATAELQEDGIAHRLVVVAFVKTMLSEFLRVFAADAEFRSGEAEDAVARTVCEEFSADGVFAIFVDVPRLDRLDDVVFRQNFMDGGVEKKRDIRFGDDEIQHGVIP